MRGERIVRAFRTSTTILLVVFLAIRLVLIRKQFFVEIQDIALLADERHAAGILAALVNLHAQHLRHLMLVVYQVAPIQTGLEDNLQALATGGDIDEQNTKFICSLLKVGGSKFFTLHS